MKTKEEILSEVTEFTIEELNGTDKIKGTPIISVSDIIQAMEQYATQQLEAEREKHDQEMVEFENKFKEQALLFHHNRDYYSKAHIIEALIDIITKFRQSK